MTIIPYIRLGLFDVMVPDREDDIGWAPTQKLEGEYVGRHQGCAVNRGRPSRIMLEINEGFRPHIILACASDRCRKIWEFPLSRWEHTPAGFGYCYTYHDLQTNAVGVIKRHLHTMFLQKEECYLHDLVKDDPFLQLLLSDVEDEHARWRLSA